MKLSPFLFAEDPARKNATLLIGTVSPYPIGQVWRFKSSAELDAWVINGVQGAKLAEYIEVDGYHVVIAFMGTMGGAVIQEGHQRQAVLQQMADFLLTTRIEADKSYWKRYKVE